MALGNIFQQEHVDDLVNMALLTSSNKTAMGQNGDMFIMGRRVDLKRNPLGHKDASKVLQSWEVNSPESDVKTIYENPVYKKAD